MSKDSIANYFQERISRDLLRDFARYVGLSTGGLKNDIVWRLVENGHNPDQLKQYCIEAGRDFSELGRQDSFESIGVPQISHKIERISMDAKSLVLDSRPQRSRPPSRSSLPSKPTLSKAKMEFNDENQSMISNNSENSKRTGQSNCLSKGKSNLSDLSKAQEATDRLVGLQEIQISRTKQIESKLALEIEQEKKRCELEFAANIAILRNKAKQKELALRSGLEMKALEYRSELNHVNNLGKELVVARNRKGNIYHSSESCSDTTVSNSHNIDCRENLIYRDRNSKGDTAGQNLKTGLPSQNLGQLPSKLPGQASNQFTGQHPLPTNAQTPPMLTYQDPDSNRINVQLSPVQQ